MSRRTPKPPILRSKRGVIVLIVVLVAIFAALYIGTGATAFFKTQPPM
jgi:hypothetical protein